LKFKIYEIIILPRVSWSLPLREEHELRMFESRVLREIFGPEWGKLAGGWKRLHNEELHKLCASPHIVRVIKSRIRWVGRVARREQIRNAYKILAVELEGRDHSEDLRLGGKIVLKWIFGKYDRKTWTGLRWLRIGTTAGLL